MARSYEEVNYTLRPAKSIERKMLVETLRNLSDFDAVDSYRYVGFGSTYFSDFTLIHKALGISDMISVERDVDKEERFKFNRPYNCIRIEFGNSNDVLPDLHWDKKTILWLDYDSKLDSNILSDVRIACSSAISGSALIVTVNANPQRFEGVSARELAELRLQQLEKDVGANKVPGDVDGKNLKGWDEAIVHRRIINNEIAQTLSERNGGCAKGEEMQYKQLFDFHYADGPKMLTTGGLLYKQEHQDTVGKCGFSRLDFVRLSGDEPYLIEVPSLTYREIQYLDAQLPLSDHTELEAKAIPRKHLRQYARVYKYFPNFAEADL